MKKLLSLIIITLFIFQSISMAAETISKETKRAIDNYINGNYTGCVQNLDKDNSASGDGIYAYYYYALSLWRKGNVNEAKRMMESVLKFNPKGDMRYYVENSIACLSDYDACKEGKIEFKHPKIPTATPVPVKKVVTKKVMPPPEIKKLEQKNELDIFIGDNHAQYFKGVNKELEQKQLELLKYEINTGKPVDDYTFQKYKKYNK